MNPKYRVQHLLIKVLVLGVYLSVIATGTGSRIKRGEELEKNKTLPMTLPEVVRGPFSSLVPVLMTTYYCQTLRDWGDSSEQTASPLLRVLNSKTGN